ncbi:hypothetical protein AA313_de0200045 [Arthrobotrys entomopaga]|nr:hypothetical protein AA313_de0200045 [Arthrobotrys entomopaga]
MVQNSQNKGKRGRAPTASNPEASNANIHSEEHIRKRQRIERGFRKAIGQAVSDHESDEESDSDSSPSSLSSTPSIKENEDGTDNDDDDDDGEEDDWEDMLDVKNPASNLQTRPSESIAEAGDLILTLEKEYVPSMQLSKKKGPSALERNERLSIHIMHVICLVYHGYLCNNWLNDKELHKNLLEVVEGTAILKRVEAYAAPIDPKPRKSKREDKKKQKGKKQLKQEIPSTKPEDVSAQSIGDTDPKLVELLGILMRFWKKRFRITANGLRKKGYPPVALEPLYVDEESEDKTNNGIEDFKERAKSCQGSRDFGAQLFTALLRALGLEARLIFSLCPLGYGFSRAEMMDEKNTLDRTDEISTVVESDTDSSDSEMDWDSNNTNSRRPRGKDSTKASKSSTKSIPSRAYDKDLKFPTFWTEVYSPVNQKWIAVDPFATGMVLSKDEDMCRLEPKGQAAARSKQQISYVVAYNADNTARDVTVRYLTKKVFPGKTKGFRMPEFEREIFSSRGDVLMTEKYDYFTERILKRFQSKAPKSPRELKEDQDLLPSNLTGSEKTHKKGFPTSLAAYKNHPRYILERHMRREDCILPGELPVHSLLVGKGKSEKEDKVYSRQSIIFGKPAENWYKEGRIIKENEQPLKLVPSRAVTVNRKREIESARREGDADAGMVGLYGFYQTELYHPEPISNGIIPKNAFGNIDCFVPSMIPEGAAHVPYRNAARLSKKLGIEYAEAVVGFEFKNRRAIPRTEGVLCTVENAEILTEACRQDEEQKLLKEGEKREQICLALWRKFLIGMRIIERVEERYGSRTPPASPGFSTNTDKQNSQDDLTNDSPMEEEEGGFLRE